MERIVEAIRSEKKSSGSSKAAISKLLGDCDDGALKKALKAAVEKEILTMNKASYMVTGEAYEDTSEKISIKEVVEVAEGPEVEKGDTVKIEYVGTLQSDGSKFDGGSLSFTVGAGDVIKGMDQGVMGMRRGSHRIVTIPSSLGYGKRGSGPEIPPNSTLIFDIKLKSIC